MSSASNESSAPASSSAAPTSSPVSSSAQPVTTTDVPATSNTPATSATPVSTPASSPAVQSTSAIAGTTPASQSPSASSPASAAAATTSTSSFTSQVATTVVSTDSAGSIVYLTTSYPEIITTSISSSQSTSSSNSHTGIIVGAVVGGVAGITILALLLFCIRRRVRKDEFDGNFDPDRVVGRADGSGGTLPHVDLAEEVTPFPQSYTDQGSSSMRQYGESPYIGVSSSFAASGQTSPGFYSSGVGTSSPGAQSRQFMQHDAGLPPSAYVSPVNMYDAAGDWHNPRPGASPPPSTTSYNTSSTRGAKEREALGRGGQGQGLGLATQPEAAESNPDVVVHRDAGRAPIEDHQPLKEIPPAYESIPQD